MNEENCSLSKTERKELKRIKNLEWKYKRGGEEESNERYSEYYKIQLKELQNEWLEFKEILSKDLPVTFRLCFNRNNFISTVLKLRFLSEVREFKQNFSVFNYCYLVSLYERKIYFS